MSVIDISLKETRDRLPPRREPYWKKIRRGEALGFRRGPDTWVARYLDRSGVYRYRALPHLHEYRDALRMARKWFEIMSSPAARVMHRDTVDRALMAYVRDLELHGREKAAGEALGRFRTVVWADPLAAIPLEILTNEDMRLWRDRIRSGRKNRTVNRYVRAVVAGLNRALRLGYVGDRQAWALQRISDEREETGDTAIFLSPEQRAALRLACPPEAQAFFRMLELTGARPREIAAAVIADYDRTGRTLALTHRKGRPARVRIRHVVLPLEAQMLILAQAFGRPSNELLFPSPHGTPWRRDAWAAAFRQAATTVNRQDGTLQIPRDASAYSFRHARISELLQLHDIDPVTVAAQTGTSVAMIEKHYARFIPAAYRDKLLSKT